MKKLAAAVLTAVMVLSVSAATAFAADQVEKQTGFCRMADENCVRGTGQCEQCENFTDEDGDQICDHYVVRVRPGHCGGRGKGLRRGCHR